MGQRQLAYGGEMRLAKSQLQVLAVLAKVN